MNSQNLKPVELECGHVLWFRFSPTSEDELLWCARCDRYRSIQQTIVAVSVAWTYWVDWDFKSRKRKRSNVYDGKCTFIDDKGVECVYELKAIYSWKGLREQMHRHYMRMHTTNGGIKIEEGIRKARNSEAPF